MPRMLPKDLVVPYRNQRLKDIRIAMDLEQKAFATALGFKHAESISRFERGDAPVPEGVYRLAEALLRLRAPVPVPGDPDPLPLSVLLGQEPLPEYAARDAVAV